jgi:hypothetical protein
VAATCSTLEFPPCGTDLIDRTYIDSLLCDHPNSLIAPGTVKVVFYDGTTVLARGQTLNVINSYVTNFAFVVATNTSTSITTSLSKLPRETFAKFTATFAVPSTEFF